MIVRIVGYITVVNTTVLIEVVIGIVVPVGAMMFAVWDARRRRRAKSSPHQPGSALDSADRPITDVMCDRNYPVEDFSRAGAPDDADRRSQAPMLSSLASATPVRTLRVFRGAHHRVPVPQTAWHSTKARDLLRILTAQRRPIPRKQLIEQLWPGADPAAASNRLSVLLSKSHNAPQTRDRVGSLASDGTLVWLRHPDYSRGGSGRWRR